MMRRGQFPGFGRGAGRHPLEPHPLERMENKIASQVAEIERLTRENQRLADTHVSLRQELHANQQELQRVESQVRSIQTESDIQIRMLLEKMKKMEMDIRAGETVKLDVQQAHKEAQNLITIRRELELEIQQATQALQKAHAEVEQLPELQVELNKLRQEYQRIRATFEYEKGINMEQVEKLYAKEKNLISMAKEVERLRNEVLIAEKRAHGSYPHRGVY